MANTLYDRGRLLWAAGQIAWPCTTPSFPSAEQFNTFLVNADYTFDATHTSLSDISASENGPRWYGTTDAAGVPMQNLDIASNGAIYADAVRFITVAAGLDPVKAIVIARIGASDVDSPLLYYADVATGLPITPNGGDIIVTWSTGTNRILRL